MISITPETVIIDARPAFEYSGAHIPKSINLNWSDFTEPVPAQKGILQEDLFAVTRRLARLGIGPDSKVVVVGNGIFGNGEEGRIAWMFAYLGIDQVQFTSLEALKPRLVNTVDAASLQSVPMWKPNVRSSLNVAKEELLFAINERGVEKPVSFEGSTPRIYRIIDVRSAKAYLGKEGLALKAHIPNMDAINIPWKEFFDKMGRIKPEMGEKLMSVGVEPTSRVIVLGEDGVTSAAATLALRALGYENAGNYAGGLNDLLSSKQR
ncbi:MAG: rhodanese-like domain-containing protein [Bdellovibrionota bacterium]